MTEENPNSKLRAKIFLSRTKRYLENIYKKIVSINKSKIIIGTAILGVIILGFSFYKVISNEKQKTNQIESELKNIQKQNLESIQNLTSEIKTQQDTIEQTKKNQDIAEKALEKINNQTGGTFSTSGIPQIDIQAIVLIICEDSSGNLQEGSGTIINPIGYVLTNEHVVTDVYGNPLSCIALMNDGNEKAKISTSVGYNLTINDSNAGYYTNSDAAVLKIYSAEYISTNTFASLPNPFPYIKPNGGNLHQGDSLYIFGYPAASNFSFNLTKGIVSSFDGAFINTDAIIDHGNSGGAAFTSDGRFIGIPTQKYVSQGDYLGQILDISTLNTS